MIKLDNEIIQADVLEVLATLKIYLEERDIQLLRDIKPLDDNVQVTCPFHKQGQERKPSFGIKKDNGSCNCFTCGWKGSITDMISQILGRDDGGKFGLKWLKSNFNNMSIETRPKLQLPDRRKRQTTNHDYVKEEELDSYRYIHEYMYKRGLTDEIIERFDIGYDSNTKCITFPVCDEFGNCVFIARRSVNTKFFNYPQGVDKPVYNLHHAKHYKKVYVVESMLNCLTYWKLGRASVAMIGLGARHQYEILNKSNVRHFVLAFDPDEAGERATIRFRNNVKNKLISEVIYVDDRDINDLQEEALDLKEIF